MTAMATRDVGLIARREVASRTRDRSFRISTAITLLVIVAIAVLPGLFADDRSTWEIAAEGLTAAALAERVAAVAPEDRETTVRRYDDRAAARTAVEDGAADVAVLGDGTLLGDEAVDEQLAGALQQASVAQRLSERLTELGLDDEAVSELATADAPAIELLNPPDVERDRRVGFAFVGSILLFMQLMGFGIWVAMSIVDDKTSRIIELLLTKVAPRTLLAGKVLGIAVIGVVQLAAMAVVGVTAFTLADRFPVPPGVWPLVGVLVVAFVLAFGLYAALFAISGALAARVEDVQSTTMPFTLLMGAGYAGAFAAVSNPGGALATWLSLVPFSSPLVMPVRIADGSATWWQVVLAMVLLVGAAAALLVVADRAYRAGALRLRRTGRWREALRPAV